MTNERKWNSIPEEVIKNYRVRLESLDENVDLSEIREVGLAAFAMSEEDKKARSGLVRLFDGLTKMAVANVLRLAIKSENTLAVQAATECLAQRGDHELLAMILDENKMTEVMTVALRQTLSRHKGLSDLLSGGSLERNKKRAELRAILDGYLSSLTVAGVVSMKWESLRAIADAYEALGDKYPQERICIELHSAIETINDYPKWLVGVQVVSEVAHFLGLTGK